MGLSEHMRIESPTWTSTSLTRCFTMCLGPVGTHDWAPVYHSASQLSSACLQVGSLMPRFLRVKEPCCWKFIKRSLSSGTCGVIFFRYFFGQPVGISEVVVQRESSPRSPCFFWRPFRGSLLCFLCEPCTLVESVECFHVPFDK